MYGLVEINTEFIFSDTFENFIDASKAANKYEIFANDNIMVLKVEDIKKIYGYFPEKRA